MEDFKYFEEIEGYVDGKMPEKDRGAFEEELERNEVLSREYKAYQATLVATDLLGFQELANIKAEKSTPIVPLRRWLAMAAAVVFITFAGLLIFANINYQPQQLLGAVTLLPNITQEDLTDSNLQTAWEAFQAEDFRQVIQLTAAERGTVTAQSDIAKTLTAFSLVNAEEFETAIPLLLELDQTDEDVQWYLAKAYLRTDQSGTAKILLDQLSKRGNSKYAVEAEQILQRMNSFWYKLVF